MINRAKKFLRDLCSNMACDNPFEAVHITAAVSALVVMFVPIGADAVILRFCEQLMLISIYSHYNIKLSEAAAHAVLTSGFAKAAGEPLAMAILEGSHAAVIISPIATWAVKFCVAASLIEFIGICTIRSLDGHGGPGAAGVLLQAMRSMGFSGDLSRASQVIRGIGGITDEAIFEKTVDASIGKASEKIKYWAEAIDAYYDNINADSGYPFAAIMHDYWVKMREKLLKMKAL